MASAPAVPPPGFDELPVEDKLDYLQALWDRIAARPEEVPLPHWHLEVVRERLAKFRSGAGPSGAPWPEVRKRLLEVLRAPAG